MSNVELGYLHEKYADGSYEKAWNDRVDCGRAVVFELTHTSYPYNTVNYSENDVAVVLTSKL